MSEHLSTVHPQNLAFYFKRQKKEDVIKADDSPEKLEGGIYLTDLVDKLKMNDIKVKQWSSASIEELTGEDHHLKVSNPGLKILNAFSVTLEDLEKS